jgi:uncharacterized membrane protein YuzA (DUF378 family)
MKALNLITLILVIIGGLNWGLVALADVNLVTAIASLFGGAENAVAKLVYLIVGLSAVYQIAPLSKAFQIGEVSAESGRY